MMRSYKKYFLLALAVILIFSISSVCANDLDNITLSHVNHEFGVNDTPVLDTNVIGESSDEITVEDWDDLQYYCSLSDKNYVLKLKENTNYYPTNPKDESYQINVNNNVTILGSSGAYFGDSSQNAGLISYIAINVPENSGFGITLKNITFKWIATNFMPNGLFLQMAGNANNIIENCNFYNCTLTGGHSSLVYLLRGDVTLTNCSFINILSDFGCVSLYDPKDDPRDVCGNARGVVEDCYFEGNYARSEPGCINNCGVLVVRNSTFYRNTASLWAGAIHTHGGANTTIYDSNFTDNLAGWNGGALYTYSYLQIYNTIFVGNNCTTNNGGGAIGATKYLHCPFIHIEDSLFEDNENLCWGLDDMSTTGTGRGGAISLMDEGALTVLNTTFIKNSASIGTAICAIAQGSYGSPNVTIIGNRFINHTRVGDVLVVRLNYDSDCQIEDNYYFANSIEFSKLKIMADDRIGDEVTVHIDAALKNPKSYDPDILEKSGYDVYMDGKYLKTVYSSEFTLNLKNIEKAQVYVVPSISISKSNEISVGLPKEYIYVSQKSGNDKNNGSKDSPVASISKAIGLASATGNIIILDGTFSETNLNVNYNLSVVGQDNVIFASKGNIFNIANADMEIKNIIFKNSKQATSSSERIIKQSGGTLKIEDCTFESNSYNTLIESDASIEANNLKFIKNTGILIQVNNYVITSSIFNSNTATTKTKSSTLIKSDGGVKGTISNSTFSNNNVLDGCVYFYSKSTQNILKITDSTFSNNAAVDGCSGILMPFTGGLLDVKSSLFVNNTDSGKNGAVILTSTEVHVSDSIFLANTMENSNNAWINAKSSTNLKKIYCSGNWFGNTNDDYSVSPPISSSSNCDYWFYLNASANATSIFQQENAMVIFDLNNIYNKEGNISYWDSSDLPTVELIISTTGGISSKKEVTLLYGLANTVFTLTDFEGSLIGKYYNVNAVVNFTEAKVNPQMNVTFKDNILVGDAEEIEVFLPGNATGTLTVNFNNITQNKTVVGSITKFNIADLPAGVNEGVITYLGDDYYASVKKTISVNVNKYNSTTKISVGDITVNQDVILTVTVSPSVTGNITLIINNNETTLTLTDSKVSYTIKSISRGDYDIKAIYNGNEKYSTSYDAIKFSVAKLNTTIDVKVKNITYGEIETVELLLNNTASGNITVSVDGKNYTSKVKNGKAIVNISDLTAGNKVIDVIYSGDNIFNPNNSAASFNVAKATTTLTITVSNIMVGDSETIEVTVARGVNGNITIECGNQCVIKNIPRIGRVSWTISDLPVGKYNVSAVLTSENYLTVNNKTNFTVTDYETPQWANEGYNIQNTGKSPYLTDSNGEILWMYNVTGNVIGNLAIDCEGNICLVTSSGIYSINNKGIQLWIYDEASNNYSGLAISRDVVIVPEAGNTLRFINQTTGEKYGNSNIWQGSSLFAPIVDGNANIYVASEYQVDSEDYKVVIIPFNIWKRGGNPTSISIGKSKPLSSPVVLNDDMVIVGCEDGLKIIDISNKVVLSSVKGNTNGIRSVVGPGNMIYAVLDNNLAEITPEGNVIWKTKITGGAGSYLALDDESGLYSINSQGNLYKYDLVDGSESLISNLTFTSGILVGNDGNVYVGSDEMLYVFDADGNVLWKSDMGSVIISSPIIDKEGIIYVPTKNKLVALTHGDLKDSNLNVSVKNIVEGEDAVITLTIDNQTTGTVSFTLNGIDYTFDAEKTTLVQKISGLTMGNYAFNVTYSGDGRFKSAIISKSFKVKSNEDTSKFISYDGNLTFSFSLENATGNLTVYINDNPYSSNLVNGTASVTVSDLDPGNYSATVVYSGDDYYSNASKIFDVEVPKIKIDVNNDTLVVDSNINRTNFIVNLPDDATGNLTVTINSKPYSNKVINGKSTVTVDDLSPGKYTAHVNYSGDKKYESIIFDDVTLNIGRLPANMSVKVDDVTVGHDVIMDITLPENAMGVVSTVILGEDYKSDVKDGRATLIVPNLAVGNYTVAVNYSGDEIYDADSKTVSFNVEAKKQSNIDIIVPSDVKEGENANISVAISDATGDVSVIFDGVDTTLPLIDGKASLNLNNLSAGSHSIVVVYGGDDDYMPSHAVSSLNVSGAPVIKPIASKFDDIVINDNVIVTMVLKDINGKVIANAPVKCSVDGVLNTSTTDIEGLLAVNAKNSANITIVYDGNETIKGTNITLTLNNLVPSVVKVKSHFNITGGVETINGYAVDTAAGEEGIYYSTQLLDDKGNPIRGVPIQFAVNDKIYARITLDDGGFTPYKLNMVRAGRYTMAFYFGGNDNYNSTFASACIDLDKKPITITASSKTYKASATKKYTVKLSTIAGSSHDGKVYLSANKKVTLTVDGVTYSGKTNSNNQVTFNLKLSKKGTYTAEIDFEGDNTYQAQSKSVKITIN